MDFSGQREPWRGRKSEGQKKGLAEAKPLNLVVATPGLEPGTQAVWMLCSNQVSYVAIRGAHYSHTGEPCHEGFGTIGEIFNRVPGRASLADPQLQSRGDLPLIWLIGLVHVEKIDAFRLQPAFI